MSRNYVFFYKKNNGENVHLLCKVMPVQFLPVCASNIILESFRCLYKHINRVYVFISSIQSTKEYTEESFWRWSFKLVHIYKLNLKPQTHKRCWRVCDHPAKLADWEDIRNAGQTGHEQLSPRGHPFTRSAPKWLMVASTDAKVLFTLSLRVLSDQEPSH